MKKSQKKNSKQLETNSLNKKTLTSQILNIFTKSPQKELNYKQISSMLSINDSHNRDLVIKALDELVGIGNLKIVSKGKYKLKSKSSHIIGTVDLKKVRDIIVLIHFMPTAESHEKNEFIEMFQKYGVSTVIYSHLHGGAARLRLPENAWGIDFHLVSADFLDFTPLLIKEF